MAIIRRPIAPVLLVSASLLALGACSGGFDVDMRDLSGGFDTTDATRLATERRPAPDARGVITYPNFQVAVAERGDTITSVAARLGLSAPELAKHNGIAPNVPLRDGEVIALPRRVDVPPGTTNADGVDIASLAGGALDRAAGDPRNTNTVNIATTPLAPPSGPATKPAPAGPEPVRHKVVRGETAFSIARLYKVSVRALADWNGLGPEMTVREGSYLLIPVASANQRNDPTTTVDATTPPGTGTRAPEPPSASKPLPEENAVASTAPPPSPNLSEDRSEASGARLLMPVAGQIIRPYDKGKNEGIAIAAAAGTKVKAAEDGTVAAITRDTDQVPILVVRHANNLLTVYANIQNVTVSKGDRVTRGQTIAEVRDSTPPFLHFEVREGFESADPVDFVN